MILTVIYVFKLALFTMLREILITNLIAYMFSYSQCWFENSDSMYYRVLYYY